MVSLTCRRRDDNVGAYAVEGDEDLSRYICECADELYAYSGKVDCCYGTIGPGEVRGGGQR